MPGPVLDVPGRARHVLDEAGTSWTCQDPSWTGLARPGRGWHVLDVPGPALDGPGTSWTSLARPGRAWTGQARPGRVRTRPGRARLVLDEAGRARIRPGRARHVLDEAGTSWTCLDEPGRGWHVLDEPGTCLDEAGTSWTRLDEPGPVLDVPGPVLDVPGLARTPSKAAKPCPDPAQGCQAPEQSRQTPKPPCPSLPGLATVCPRLPGLCHRPCLAQGFPVTLPPLARALHKVARPCHRPSRSSAEALPNTLPGTCTSLGQGPARDLAGVGDPTWSNLRRGPPGGRIGATWAESQWIVAARPLCHLQYPVAYLSRLQRILPAARWEFLQGVPCDSSAARVSPTTRAFGGRGPYCWSANGRRAHASLLARILT